MYTTGCGMRCHKWGSESIWENRQMEVYSLLDQVSLCCQVLQQVEDKDLFLLLFDAVLHMFDPIFYP